MEWQLHRPIASVIVHLNIFNLQTAKKGEGGEGSNLVLEIFTVHFKVRERSENWWNKEMVQLLPPIHSLNMM